MNACKNPVLVVDWLTIPYEEYSLILNADSIRFTLPPDHKFQEKWLNTLVDSQRNVIVRVQYTDAALNIVTLHECSMRIHRSISDNLKYDCVN